MAWLSLCVCIAGLAFAPLPRMHWAIVFGLIGLAVSLVFCYQLAYWRNTRITFDGEALNYYDWRGECRLRIPLDEILDLSSRQVGWGLQGYLVRAKHAEFKFDGSLSDAGELVGLIRKTLSA